MLVVHYRVGGFIDNGCNARVSCSVKMSFGSSSQSEVHGKNTVIMTTCTTRATGSLWCDGRKVIAWRSNLISPRPFIHMTNFDLAGILIGKCNIYWKVVTAHCTILQENLAFSCIFLHFSCTFIYLSTPFCKPLFGMLAHLA